MFSLMSSSSNNIDDDTARNIPKRNRSSEYHDEQSFVLPERTLIPTDNIVTSWEEEEEEEEDYSTIEENNNEFNVNDDEPMYFDELTATDYEGDGDVAVEEDPLWDQLESLIQRDCIYDDDMHETRGGAVASCCNSDNIDSNTSRARCRPFYHHRHHQQEFRLENNNVGYHHRLTRLNDWRKKMCLWSFRIVDHWRYDRHIVAITMNFLDRYMIWTLQQQQSNSSTIKIHNDDNNEQSYSSRSSQNCYTEQETGMSQSEYQLAAMTCLYLTMKLNPEQPQQQHQYQPYSHIQPYQQKQSHHHKPLPLRLISFVELSRGQFNMTDICTMERKILQVVRWKVHPVVAADIVSSLLNNVWKHTTISTPVYQALEELVIFICELTIIHLGSTSTHQFRPYVMASASMLLAMEVFTEQALPTPIRYYFQSLEQSIIQVAESNGGINGKLHSSTPRQNNQVQGQVDEIKQVESILQTTLWKEVVQLIKEEERSVHHLLHPENPIAIALSLHCIDLKKVYNFHHNQYKPNYRTPGSSTDEDSTSSSTISMTASSSSLLSSSPLTNKVAGDTSPNRRRRHPHSLSPITTPKPVICPNDSIILDDNTSPIGVAPNFISLV
jgi:Cyclin, N-terminal domain